MGTRKRLPVGQDRRNLHGCGARRAPEGAAVGARERLPVERTDVRERGRGRAPRCVAVGARERLPVGSPWDTATCTRAAKGGHLDVLQWARSNGCPWDEDTCAFAARCGKLDVLQWAHANGCEWIWDRCEAQAKRNQHDNMLPWLRENKPTEP